MYIWWIVVGVVLFLVFSVVGIWLVIEFLKSVKVCEGGFMEGCGKFIFPWEEKMFLLEKYCCTGCMEKEIRVLSQAEIKDKKEKELYYAG